MHTFIPLDLGASFLGLVGRVGDTTVCVLTSRVLNDESVRPAVRKLVELQGGGECASCDCLGCPLRQSLL